MKPMAQEEYKEQYLELGKQLNKLRDAAREVERQRLELATEWDHQLREKEEVDQP
jgi:hypothetical protein